MGTIIFIPKMGANIEEVKIGKLLVHKGDHVKKNNPLFEIVTYKATFAIEAEGDGQVLELNCKEGEDAYVLDELGYIGQKNDKVPKLKRRSTKPAAERTTEQSKPLIGQKKLQDKIKATPSAKKLAEKYNINLVDIFSNVSKIIKEKDIEEYIKNSNLEKVEKINISQIKKTEIDFLSYSKECLQSSLTVQFQLQKF